MKTHRSLSWMVGIAFFSISLIPLSLYAEKDIDNHTSIQLKEIKQIDFRDLPENINFINPSRIAFNSKNELFVTDTRANNIKVFDADGKFLKIIGQEGKGPGDLNRPSCITFNRKYIIVWELGNYRFSLFNEDGEFIRHFKPEHPAVVWKLKSLGNGQVVFEIRQGYCENEKSVLYILDNELEKGEEFYNHSIKREHYENKIQDDLKIPFGPLVSWDVMGENKIVVGYQEEYKINVYYPDRDKLFTIGHQSKRLKVTQKDKKEYFSSMVYMTNGQTVQGAPPLIKKYTDFPKYKPYYKDILVSPEKEIWVFLYTESDEQKLVDIFNRDGKFVKSVEFEKDLGYRPIFADDGTLWTVKEDETGYNVIVQFETLFNQPGDKPDLSPIN